jgi:hypothetical protein
VRLRSKHVATIVPQIPRPASPSASATEEVEAVEVVRWRGYVTSAFYARRLSDGEVLAISPTFRWRKSAPPSDAGPARIAYDSLVTELLEHGWFDQGTTGHWYERRFEQTRVQPIVAAATALPVADGRSPVETPPPVVDEPRPASDVPRDELTQPVEQPPSEPAVAVSGRSLGGRRAAFGIVIAAAILIAGVFAVHGGMSDGSTKGAATPATPKHGSGAVVASAPTTHGATVAAAPADARLEVEGVGSGSWLEVRVGSANGRVLFSGVVHDGGHRRFHARRLWVTFGAASNLAITVNGVAQRLQGTVEALVTDHSLTAP